MPAIKVIKKQSRSAKKMGIDPDEVGKMFEELIGTNRVNILYANPRALKMKESIYKFLSAGKAMTERFFLDDIEIYNKYVDFMFNAVATLEILNKLPKFTDEELYCKTYTDEKVLKFTEVYNEFRASDTLKYIMISAGQLKAISTQLEAKDPEFIYSGSGFYFKPLVFCPDFNIYSLRHLDRKDPIVRSWVTYLCKLYELGLFLSDELQKPDIDIKQFCETVIQILTAAEKEPGLQGCRQAFDKIKESMHLLEENFSKYYKEFVNSDKNSSTIFVSFIKDVTEKNANAQIGIIAQFSKILNFYTEQMDKSGVKLDPKIIELTKSTKEQLSNFGKAKKDSTPGNDAAGSSK